MKWFCYLIGFTTKSYANAPENCQVAAACYRTSTDEVKLCEKLSRRLEKQDKRPRDKQRLGRFCLKRKEPRDPEYLLHIFQSTSSNKTLSQRT
jgi:hypothetical protein